MRGVVDLGGVLVVGDLDGVGVSFDDVGGGCVGEGACVGDVGWIRLLARETMDVAAVIRRE